MRNDLIGICEKNPKKSCKVDFYNIWWMLDIMGQFRLIVAVCVYNWTGNNYWDSKSSFMKTIFWALIFFKGSVKIENKLIRPFACAESECSGTLLVLWPIYFWYFSFSLWQFWLFSKAVPIKLNYRSITIFIWRNIII